MQPDSMSPATKIPSFTLNDDITFNDDMLYFQSNPMAFPAKIAPETR
jgi:hypothetical protein